MIKEKLSNRLSVLCALTPVLPFVADVGCDHGYLGAALLEEGKVSFVIASDKREGPLAKARQLSETEPFAGKMVCVLSDGLTAPAMEVLLKEQPEPGILIMAGMGGMLMLSILHSGEKLLPHFRYLLLQPQHDIPKVREYLAGEGYRISREEMIMEDGKYYTMMLAEKLPEGQTEPLSREALLFGPCLLEEKNQVLAEYLTAKISVLKRAEEEILKAGGRSQIDRLKEIREEQEELKRVLFG